MIHSTILYFLGYKKSSGSPSKSPLLFCIISHHQIKLPCLKTQISGSSVESFKCRICKYTLQNLSYFSWKWKMLEVKFQDQSWGFS
ncbi:hypothetical protein ERO13_A08G124050v2 [Gossypium hirsutum]|nr:hypothetical protein ERO13_A08G124050v2 [Gossypium hirsutum]